MGNVQTDEAMPGPPSVTLFSSDHSAAIMSAQKPLLKCQHADISSQHAGRDRLSVRVCIFRATGGTLGSPGRSDSKWVTWFPETQKEQMSRDSGLQPLLLSLSLSLTHTQTHTHTCSHILPITLHYSPTVGTAPRVGRGSDWSHYSAVTSHSSSLLSNQVRQRNRDVLPRCVRVS